MLDNDANFYHFKNYLSFWTDLKYLPMIKYNKMVYFLISFSLHLLLLHPPSPSAPLIFFF